MSDIPTSDLNNYASRDRRGYAPSDPSFLTTQQVLRESEHLRELVFSHFKEIEARLAAMDKAQELFEANLTRVPTDVDKSVSQLKTLHEERFSSVEDKFSGIDKEFGLRDNTVDKLEKLSKEALAAALSAAEKAVDAALKAAEKATEKQNEVFAELAKKSDGNFTRQFESTSEIIRTTTKTSDDKFSLLDNRITRIEGKGEGVSARTVFVGVSRGGGGTSAGVISMIITLSRVLH